MALRVFDKLVLRDGIVDINDNSKIVSFDISSATTSTTTDLLFNQTVDRTVNFRDNDGDVILQNDENPTITNVSSAIDNTSRNSFLNSSLTSPDTGVATLADSVFGTFEKTITYSTVAINDEPIDITVSGVIDDAGTTQTTIRLPNQGTGISLIWNGSLWLVSSIVGNVTFS